MPTEQLQDIVNYLDTQRTANKALDTLINNILAARAVNIISDSVSDSQQASIKEPTNNAEPIFTDETVPF